MPSPPLPRSVPQALFEAADRFGPRRALVDDDEAVSFAALAQETRRAAKAFIAVGLKSGEPVGVWAPNLWRWVAAAAGAQAAGGVLIPLNSRLRAREVARLAMRVRARLLVSVGRFLGQDYPAALGDQDAALERIVVLGDTAASDPRVQSWAAFLNGGDAVQDAEFSARLAAVGPDDLADTLFTSGTTGEPKGAVFSHWRTLRCAQVWRSVIPVAEGDGVLAFGSFSHTASYKGGWVASLLAGSTLYAGNRTDALSLMQLIQEARIRIMPAPPTVLQAILNHPERVRFDLSSLEIVSTGGTVVPIEMIHRLRTDLRVRHVATGYGLTECGGTVTLTRGGDPPEIVSRTAGRAAPGVEVRCVREDGSVCEVGEAGEVSVRTDKMMLRYLDDPAATAAAIDPEGWLRTGDLGRLDSGGNLEVVDRLKDMYIVGGFNCYPAEIERDLGAIPGVLHCAVIGVPDARLGEIGRAFIVRAPGALFGEDEVIAWCRANLATYKAPSSVVFLDALPLNAQGKVLKGELRTLAAKQAEMFSARG